MTSSLPPEPAAVPAVTPAPVRSFTRASKACRRCRRLRTKCTNEGDQLPCLTCRQANAECIFPRRGEVDSDRMFRQRPVRQDGSVSTSPRASHDQTHNESIVGVGHTPDRNIVTTPGASAPSVVSCRESALVQQPSTPHPRLGWEALPPYDEVVQGV